MFSFFMLGVLAAVYGLGFILCLASFFQAVVDMRVSTADALVSSLLWPGTLMVHWFNPESLQPYDGFWARLRKRAVIVMFVASGMLFYLAITLFFVQYKI